MPFRTREVERLRDELGRMHYTLAAVREWAEDGIRRYGGVSPWHAEVLAILSRSDTDE